MKTPIALIICVSVVWLGAVGTVGYVAVHFITKFW